MARCYHNTEHFRADNNVEVAREGGILQKKHDLYQFPCKKNPGHLGFIPFKDLALDDIPREDRSNEMLENIKRWGDCVVRLKIDMNDGSGAWFGSGWLVKRGKEYQIKTNHHVIETNDHVKHCTVEFNYNDNSNINKNTVCTGVELKYTNAFRDISTFSFNPVPKDFNDLDLPIPNPSLPYIVIMYKDKKMKTDRTCSHCMSSQRFYYTSVNLNNQDIDTIVIHADGNSFSYLKSSYFTFKPIPSNIQELTRIEIRIDEDDGNSRVIPGEIVKFGDEFVVKISEFISDDKVKKCRLVWTGEVISRGEQLYFEQVKSRDFFHNVDGIDLEHLGAYFPNNIWLFGVDPQPRIEMSNNYEFTDKHIMCCIGHPHGGMKMVSFGPNLYGTWLERSNGHGRPKEECMCQVPSVKYTCATCPGSSGSPVFLTDTTYDMDSAVTHVEGERMVAFLPNTMFNKLSRMNAFVGKRKKLLLPDSELGDTNLNTGWG